MNLHFEICWRHGQNGQEFEPQLFALLEEIAASGSLQVAARECGVSYRYAWGLMRKWEQLLKQPLADLQRGRGAKLTALGAKLLWAQHRVQARLAPDLESLASELGTEIARTVADKGTPALRAFASHGLALGVLREMVNEAGALHLDLQFRGSLESLRLYRAGKCDVAGFHLPEGALGRRLAPRYRRHLDPQGDALVHVVRRQQGFITAPGNPKKIASVRDLTRKGVRFVNRQPSAGTRLIFDLLLEDTAVEADRIHGYATEEFTHMAVAAMVASGAADAGFGIKAAAAQFGLGFVPVTEENYLFAVRRQALNTPAMVEVLRILRSRDYQKRVAALPGYDANGAGIVLPVQQLLPTTD